MGPFCSEICYNQLWKGIHFWDEKEKTRLKEIVDGLKCKELNIDPLNRKVVDLINNKQETFFCDYKMKYHEKKMIYYMTFCVYQIIQKIVMRI